LTQRTVVAEACLTSARCAVSRVRAGFSDLRVVVTGSIDAARVAAAAFVAAVTRETRYRAVAVQANQPGLAIDVIVAGRVGGTGRLTMVGGADEARVAVTRRLASRAERGRGLTRAERCSVAEGIITDTMQAFDARPKFVVARAASRARLAAGAGAEAQGVAPQVHGAHGRRSRGASAHGSARLALEPPGLALSRSDIAPNVGRAYLILRASHRVVAEVRTAAAGRVLRDALMAAVARQAVGTTPAAGAVFSLLRERFARAGAAVVRAFVAVQARAALAIGRAAGAGLRLGRERAGAKLENIVNAGRDQEKAERARRLRELFMTLPDLAWIIVDGATRCGGRELG